MTEPTDRDPRELQEVERVRSILAGTTPADRLRWLEEAIEFARWAGALPRHPVDG